MDTIHAIHSIARAHNAAFHLDGARLFNAVVASRISAKERVQSFDTISVCFSKGLGSCRIRTLYAQVYEKRCHSCAKKNAWWWNATVGLLAARAAQYALKNNIAKIRRDHQHARIFALGLSQTELKVQAPQSNMVYFFTSQCANARRKAERKRTVGACA